MLPILTCLRRRISVMDPPAVTGVSCIRSKAVLMHSSHCPPHSWHRSYFLNQQRHFLSFLWKKTEDNNLHQKDKCVTLKKNKTFPLPAQESVNNKLAVDAAKESAAERPEALEDSQVTLAQRRLLQLAFLCRIPTSNSHHASYRKYRQLQQNIQEFFALLEKENAFAMHHPQLLTTVAEIMLARGDVTRARRFASVGIKALKEHRTAISHLVACCVVYAKALYLTQKYAESSSFFQQALQYEQLRTSDLSQPSHGSEYSNHDDRDSGAIRFSEHDDEQVTDAELLFTIVTGRFAADAKLHRWKACLAMAEEALRITTSFPLCLEQNENGEGETSEPILSKKKDDHQETERVRVLEALQIARLGFCYGLIGDSFLGLLENEAAVDAFRRAWLHVSLVCGRYNPPIISQAEEAMYHLRLGKALLRCVQERQPTTSVKEKAALTSVQCCSKITHQLNGDEKIIMQQLEESLSELSTAEQMYLSLLTCNKRSTIEVQQHYEDAAWLRGKAFEHLEIYKRRNEAGVI